MFCFRSFFFSFITVKTVFFGGGTISLKLLKKKSLKSPKITFWNFVRHPGGVLLYFSQLHIGFDIRRCKNQHETNIIVANKFLLILQWITQTILTRIIKEIKDVNLALTVHGVTNVSIGSSGLERLKKTAAMSQVYQNIPSLSSLISFLDVSSNQEYVVQRISGG